MRRVKGEEVLILGCHKHFSLVDTEANSLREIMALPNVHNGDILDFELHNKYLYSRGQNESDVKVTTFGMTPPPKPVISRSELVPPVSREPKPVVLVTSKYESFKRFKIECGFITESFEKIAVSAKGNRVFAGGKGLYVFERDVNQDSKYHVLTYEGNENRNFFALKAARSGHFIMQESTTNDLVITDNTGEEVMRRTGAQKAVFDQTMARNPHFNGEVDTILWFSGTTSISVVNLKDLSYAELKNFLPSYGKGQDGVAIRGVMKNGGKDLLIFFIVENQPCLAYLGSGMSEPEILFVDEKLPSCTLQFT